MSSDDQISTVINTVNETHDQVMKLTVTVNSLIARLEAFEKMHTSNNVAPKRAIKVTPVQEDDTVSISSSASKPKAAKPKAAKPKSTEGEKIINTLAFFKKIVVFKDYNNLRTKYCTDDMINTASIGIVKPEGTEAYWNLVGNAIWKILDKEVKKDVKLEYIKWKNLHQVISDVSQLNEDDAESS